MPVNPVAGLNVNDPSALSVTVPWLAGGAVTSCADMAAGGLALLPTALMLSIAHHPSLPTSREPNRNMAGVGPEGVFASRVRCSLVRRGELGPPLLAGFRSSSVIQFVPPS